MTPKTAGSSGEANRSMDKIPAGKEDHKSHASLAKNDMRWPNLSFPNSDHHEASIRSNTWSNQDENGIAIVTDVDKVEKTIKAVSLRGKSLTCVISIIPFPSRGM